MGTVRRRPEHSQVSVLDNGSIDMYRRAFWDSWMHDVYLVSIRLSFDWDTLKAATVQELG